MTVVVAPEKITSASEARQRFSHVLEEARAGQHVVIHQPKHKDVMIVSRDYVWNLRKALEELISTLESIELAQDTAAMAAIKRSEEDIKSGRTIALEDAARTLKERAHRRGNRRDRT